MLKPPNPAGRTSLEGGLASGEAKQKKIRCSFLDKMLLLSLVGSLGNRRTCGLEPRKEMWFGTQERDMGWRCYGSSASRIHINGNQRSR